MLALSSPERRSSAGVCSAPQAATTARERTVTRWPSSVRASTPRAAPPSMITRSARVVTTKRAPAPAASASQVLFTDCLAPIRQPKTAVAALLALLATADIAWHCVDVPAERVAARAHDLVAARGLVVLEVDAQALDDGVKAPRVLLAGECRHAVARPFLAHLVGCAERGRVVDDGAAAEARAGEQPDALVVAGLRRAQVESCCRAVTSETVEVGVVVIAAHLEDDDVEPGRGEHAGRGAPTRARADDNDVAAEVRIGGDLERLQGLRRGVGLLAERTREAHRLPHRVG